MSEENKVTIEVNVHNWSPNQKEELKKKLNGKDLKNVKFNVENESQVSEDNQTQILLG